MYVIMPSEEMEIGNVEFMKIGCSYQGCSAIVISLIGICPKSNQTFHKIKMTIMSSTVHPRCQLCFHVANSQVEF